MIDPEDGPDWSQLEDTERRQFDEWQQALKDDAEAYHRWLMELERELLGLGLFGPTPDECRVQGDVQCKVQYKNGL